MSRSGTWQVKIGAWMKRNGESIYGCGKAGMEKPDNGRITRKGNKLYYHSREGVVPSLIDRRSLETYIKQQEKSLI